MHISAHVSGTMFSECPDTRMNKMQALSSRHWPFREDNGRLCKNGERDIGGKGESVSREGFREEVVNEDK